MWKKSIQRSTLIMVQKTRLKIAIHKFLDEFFLPALFLSVSLSQKKNLLRSTFHDATMQYPVTVVRIFLLAAICMTQRRISRTPSVKLLVRRRKRGWTRGRRWVTRAQWVDTCVPCLPQQSAKTPVNNASIRYIGHCACTTLVFWPCLFLLTFPLFFVKMQLVSHLYSVIFGVFFTDVARFSFIIFK